MTQTAQQKLDIEKSHRKVSFKMPPDPNELLLIKIVLSAIGDCFILMLNNVVMVLSAQYLEGTHGSRDFSFALGDFKVVSMDPKWSLRRF